MWKGKCPKLLTTERKREVFLAKRERGKSWKWSPSLHTKSMEQPLGLLNIQITLGCPSSVTSLLGVKSLRKKQGIWNNEEGWDLGLWVRHWLIRWLWPSHVLTQFPTSQCFEDDQVTMLSYEPRKHWKLASHIIVLVLVPKLAQGCLHSTAVTAVWT